MLLREGKALQLLKLKFKDVSAWRLEILAASPWMDWSLLQSVKFNVKDVKCSRSAKQFPKLSMEDKLLQNAKFKLIECKEFKFIPRR